MISGSAIPKLFPELITDFEKTNSSLTFSIHVSHTSVLSGDTNICGPLD